MKERKDFNWTHPHLKRWTDSQAAIMINTGHHCGSCVGCNCIPIWNGKPDSETICNQYLRKTN